MDNHEELSGPLHTGARTSAESQHELKQYIEDARRHDEAEAEGQPLTSRAEVYRQAAQTEKEFLAKQKEYDEADRARAQAWHAERDRAKDEAMAVARAQAEREEMAAEQAQRQTNAREPRQKFKLPDSVDKVWSFIKGF